jgi:hypothetical protein
MGSTFFGQLTSGRLIVYFNCAKFRDFKTLNYSWASFKISEQRSNIMAFCDFDRIMAISPLDVQNWSSWIFFIHQHKIPERERTRVD